MNRVLRAVVVLRILPEEPRFVTVRQLVGMLEANGARSTERTVQRLLQDLARCLPLVCRDRSAPYGWSWARGAKQVCLVGQAPSR